MIGLDIKTSSNYFEKFALMKSIKRDYGIFIIEALGCEDLFEGEYLFDILEGARVLVEIRRVASREEFKQAIIDFDKFNFRYLHISCHGLEDNLGFCLVNEKVLLPELEYIIKGRMHNRRISLSICYSGQKKIAEIFIKEGAYSVLGHPNAVESSRACIFWATFYLIMNDEDKCKMKRKHILQFLKSQSRLLKIPIYYYSFIRKEWQTKLRLTTINTNGHANGKKMKIE